MVRAVLTVTNSGDDTFIDVTYENEPAVDVNDPTINANGFYRLIRNFHNYPYNNGLGRTADANFPPVHSETPPESDTLVDQPNLKSGTVYRLSKSSASADETLMQKRLHNGDTKLLKVRYPAGVAWCFTDRGVASPVNNQVFLQIVPTSYFDASSEAVMAEWFGDNLPTSFSCTEVNDPYKNYWEAPDSDFVTIFYSGKGSASSNAVDVMDFNSQPWGFDGSEVDTAEPDGIGAMLGRSWGAAENISLETDTPGVFTPWYRYWAVTTSANNGDPGTWYAIDATGVNNPEAAQDIDLRTMFFPNESLFNSSEGSSGVWSSGLFCWAAFDLPDTVNIWTDGNFTNTRLAIQYHIHELPDTTPNGRENFATKLVYQDLFTGTVNDETKAIACRSVAVIPDKCYRIRIVFFENAANFNSSITMERAQNGASSGIYHTVTPRPTPFGMFSLGEAYYLRGKQLVISSQAFPTP